jgi:hypothetical protein
MARVLAAVIRRFRSDSLAAALDANAASLRRLTAELRSLTETPAGSRR